MQWPWVDEAIASAKALVAGSRFAWTFEADGPRVEARARGVVVAHHFDATTGPMHIGPKDSAVLLEAVRLAEARASATADRFHRATPWPYFLKSQVEAMTYRELVDAALDQYKGLSLQALSLGPEEWAGFIAETGLVPDELGHVEWRGVPVTAGMEGIKYIVGD